MNKLPPVVGTYIQAIRQSIESDPMSVADLFNEYVSPEYFWPALEAKSMSKYAETNDPVLTPEEFKDVHFEVFKYSMDQAFESLKEKGIIEESSEGFTLTQLGQKFEHLKKKS